MNEQREVVILSGVRTAIGASRGSRPRTVSASTFEFISERGQIGAVHEFMESLATTLGC